MLEYSLQVLQGALLTLEVFFFSVIFSIFLGLITAWAKLSKNKLLSLIARLYTTIIRGVPDLVLMLLLFYGGQILLNQVTESLGWDFIEINPFVSGGAHHRVYLRGLYGRELSWGHPGHRQGAG